MLIFLTLSSCAQHSVCVYVCFVTRFTGV